MSSEAIVLCGPQLRSISLLVEEPSRLAAVANLRVTLSTSSSTVTDFKSRG